MVQFSSHISSLGSSKLNGKSNYSKTFQGIQFPWENQRFSSGKYISNENTPGLFLRLKRIFVYILIICKKLKFVRLLLRLVIRGQLAYNYHLLATTLDLIGYP